MPNTPFLRRDEWLCDPSFATLRVNRKTTLPWRNHHRADLIAGPRLYFLEPKPHSKPRYMPGDYLGAPLASSSSTDSPEATSLPQDVAPERAEGSATTDKLRDKDYRPRTDVRGSRRRRRDDCWAFTPDGKHAI